MIPAWSTEARGRFYQLSSGNRESSAYLPEGCRLLAGRGLVNKDLEFKDLEFRHVLDSVTERGLHTRARAWPTQRLSAPCASQDPRDMNEKENARYGCKMASISSSTSACSL